jgi:hypothetical protein
MADAQFCADVNNRDETTAPGRARPSRFACFANSLRRRPVWMAGTASFGRTRVDRVACASAGALRAQ